MQRRTINLALVLLLALVLFLAGCSKNDLRQKGAPDGLAAQSITVAETVRSMQNAPLYLAIEKGFLTEEKLTANLVAQTDFWQAAQDLQAGKIQFLITTSDKILYLHQQGMPDFRLIAQLSSSGSYQLLARKAGPFQWLDLKGKVILGYQGGDWPYTLLYAQLRRQGLRPFVSVHPVENLTAAYIPAAYRAGSGHYLLTDEPLLSLLESEGNGQIVTKFSLAETKLPAYAVLVSQNFLQDNRKICQQFLHALAQSAAWLDQESPAEIANAVKGYFPAYPENVLQRAAGRYKNNGCWSGLELDEQAFQALQEIMLQEKELRQLIPVSQLLEPSLLPKG